MPSPHRHIVSPTDWYEATAVQLAGENTDLRADVQVYREIATAAIHELHRLTTARDRDRERYLLLLAELRALRGNERRAA